MRLWSLHPRYLDRAGLVALWREALLAQAVLRGGTRGYRFHPQLVRFRNQPDPEAAIAAYLEAVCREAAGRGYRFAAIKIGRRRSKRPIPVTRGQLRYERTHLLKKLLVRDPLACKTLTAVGEPEPHPLFTIVEGGVERWEQIPENRNGKVL
ncbi:MAG: pyrimidine dimer DNA glycosylase/endonuclease V [Deltaproteobacteria bacterium]|nr:pyrimidine dimer DNA glycosylase/endonuclease V [Deltaproteobacteria bacterium]